MKKIIMATAAVAAFASLSAEADTSSVIANPPATASSAASDQNCAANPCASVHNTPCSAINCSPCNAQDDCSPCAVSPCAADNPCAAENPCAASTCNPCTAD